VPLGLLYAATDNGEVAAGERALGPGQSPGRPREPDVPVGPEYLKHNQSATVSIVGEALSLKFGTGMAANHHLTLTVVSLTAER